MKTNMDRLFFRDFELDRAAVNDATRELTLTFSSEFPVYRWFGAEVLLHGRENVDLSRLKRRGAVLMNHQPSMIVGPIKDAEVTDKRQGQATIGFDDDADGERAFGKVKSGSLRGVSVGYIISKFREVREGEEWESGDGLKVKGPAYVATRWAPYEISLTPIPADPTIGIGRDATRSLDGIEIERGDDPRHFDPTQNEEGQEMNEEAIRAMLEGFTKQIVDGVRALIPQTPPPVTRSVTDDQLRDLHVRGCAVSPEVGAEVTRMALDGKGEAEILRHITDKATNPDAQRRKPTEPGDQGRGLSAKDIDDDTFARGICSPSAFPLQ